MLNAEVWENKRNFSVLVGNQANIPIDEINVWWLEEYTNFNIPVMSRV